MHAGIPAYRCAKKTMSIFTSAWKSSPKTGKRPRLDWTKTAQDWKFPGPLKTATVVWSSVSHDFRNLKTVKTRRFRISSVWTTANPPVCLSGSHGTCHHQTQSQASSPLCRSCIETWSLKFWKLDSRLLAPMWCRFTLKWLAKSKWQKTATKLKLLGWRVNGRSTKLHSFTLGWRYVSIDLIKIIAHYISGGCHPGSIWGPRRLRLAPFHHRTVHECESGIRHLKQLLQRAGMEDGRGGGKVSCPQHLPHHLQLTSTTQCNLPHLAGPWVPQTAHSPTHSIPMPSPLCQRRPHHNVPPPNHVQNHSVHNSMWMQQWYPHPAVNLFAPWTTTCLEVRKWRT